MNVTFKEFFDKAELSLAAYSDFSGIPKDGNGAFISEYIKNRLTVIPAGKTVSDFSTTEADKFLERFEVLDQFTDNTLINGFSATVFRDKSNGQIYFVNRGTDDVFADGVISDRILAFGGKPLKQIVSMVNYYLRLQAGSGNMARQIEYVSVAAGVFADFTFSSTLVAGVGSVPGIGNTAVVVAGHSLGGYLSTIFGYLFGSTTSSVFTFNAPGSWGIEVSMNRLAALLGSTNPSYSGNQTNLIGDYLVSAVPGHRGTDIRIFEEGSAHSQKVMTDSLALQHLLAKLDSSLNPSIADSILRAGSAVDGDSLEKILDALRKTILSPNSVDTKVAGVADSQTSREAYYANLYLLMGSNAFTSLAGKVKITLSTADLATQVRTNFSALVSLVTLSPITLVGVDAAAQALLESTVRSVWSASPVLQQWLDDKKLTAEQRAAGEANFSDKWLNDRAGFLDRIVQRNLLDQQDLESGVGVRYTDVTSGQVIVTGMSGNEGQKPQIYFGSESTDSFSGSNLSDHLYGGGGADNLSGGGGRDYLEGNDGNDTLNGDAGDDTICGGAGDDILDGGEDEDWLYGGAGNDAYLVKEGAGVKHIKDSDGIGTVYIELNRLTGGQQASKNIWVSDDKKTVYTLTQVEGDGINSSELKIQNGTNMIIVSDWSKERNLGIFLENLPTVPLVEPVTTDVRVYTETHGVSTTDDAGSNHITLTDYSDEIDASRGGNDIIFALGGNDYISLGSGASLVYGGAGFDFVSRSGGGNDIFIGGADPDAYVATGEGDDWIYGGEHFDLQEAIDVGNNQERQAPDGTATGEGAGEWLDGGDGNDLVVGDATDDVLLGGGGNDSLVGGGGDDLIFGDKQTVAGSVIGADLSRLNTEQLAWVNSRFSLAPDATYVTHKVTREITNNGATFSYSFVAAAEGGIAVEDGIAYGNDVINAGKGADWVFSGKGDDIVFGEDGNDLLFGEEGADKLFGGVGDDTLIGEGGANDSGSSNYLDGGAGNDQLIGGGGDDIIFGGAGNDQFIGGGGNDVMFGGAGNDYMWGDLGGASADQVGDDYLYGEDGDDKISGNGGNDVLKGGEGNDSLWGDDSDTPADKMGDDYLDGGAGNDQLMGLGGNDILFGGSGDDRIWGDQGAASTAGNDYLNGEEGDDQLSGDGGNDTLLGGAGDDSLWGDDGNDYLDGGVGHDQLLGGAGNDTLAALEGGQKELAGGEGDDLYLIGTTDQVDITDVEGRNRIIFSGSISDLHYVKTITPTRTAGALIGNGFNVVLWDSESAAIDSIESQDGSKVSFVSLLAEYCDNNNVTAIDSASGRWISGADDSYETIDVEFQTIAGGRGDDWLELKGGGKNILFRKGDGEDTYLAGGNGESRDNILTFGNGIAPDALSFELKSGSLYVRLGQGDGTVRIANVEPDISTGNWISNALFSLFRFDDGSEYSIDQMISMRGVAIDGGWSSSKIQGLAGDDTLSGGGGDDSLIGGAGSDIYRFDFGDGTDWISEGSGDVGATDILFFGEGVAQSNLSFGRAGSDLIIFINNGYGGRISISGGAVVGNEAIELLRFADGTDLDVQSILADLPELQPIAMSIYGSQGADSITAGFGDDTLDGDIGNDLLVGGAGNDVVLGGDGRDTLVGGIGDDSLSGGAGDDEYILDASMDWDLIQDSEGSNTVRFGPGISLDNLLLSQRLVADGRRYLYIAFGPSGGVSIENGELGFVRSFVFSDGTTLSYQDLMALMDQVVSVGSSGADSICGGNGGDYLAGGDGDDSISGEGGGDSIFGGRGNDLLFGGDGDDELQGGGGNDVLCGGNGANDVYYLAYGSGNDRIEDPDGGVLQVGGGLVDLAKAQQGSDLIISIKGGGDQVVLADYFLNSGAEWFVKDAFGSVYSLDGVLAGMPDSGAVNKADVLSSARESVLNALRQMVLGAGYSYVGENTYSRIESGGYGFYTATESDLLSIKFVNSASSETYIDARLSLNSVVLSRTENVYTKESYYLPQDTSIPVSDTLRSNSKPYIYLSDFSKGDGFSIPGSTVTPLISPSNQGDVWHGGDTFGQGTSGNMVGYYVQPNSSAGNSVSIGDTTLVKVVMTYRQVMIEYSSELTAVELQAGDENNNIYVTGGTLVSAGGGDDYIYVSEYSLNGFSSVAAYLYGESGDDTIEGGAGGDTVIGGVGNDNLDGVDGGDFYYFFDGDGQDFVRDSGVGSEIDTVILPEMATLSNICVSAGYRILPGRERRYSENRGDDAMPAWEPWVSGDMAYSTVVLSWGGVDSVEIVIPHDSDPVGSGIERIQFADGSSVDFDFLLAAHGLQSHDSVQENENLIVASKNEYSRLLGAGGDDTLIGNGMLDGGAGDDFLYGGVGDDTLLGQQGSDVFFGGDGADVLGKSLADFWELGNIYYGGAGDDQIFGSRESDTYFFDIGDGHDRVRDHTMADVSDGAYAYGGYAYLQSIGVPEELLELEYMPFAAVKASSAYLRDSDILKFGEGIRPEDIRLFRTDERSWENRDGKQNAALTFALSNGVDGITFEGWFDGEGHKLKSVEFYDGTIWDQSYLDSLEMNAIPMGSLADPFYLSGASLLGSDASDLLQGFDTGTNVQAYDGDDLVTGGDGADSISGGMGRDTIDACGGYDTIEGGAGGDVLAGGSGNDTYLYLLGDGLDTISENDSTTGNVDLLQFGSGIDASQLWFSRCGSNLEVSIIGSSEGVVLTDWYLGSPYHVEQFRDGVGNTLLDSQVDALVDAMAAFGAPPAGQTTLPSDYQSTLNPVIAANWR